jgi:hypothetical protein
MMMAIVLCLGIAGLNSFASPVSFSLYGVIVLLLLLTVLFRSLTVEVDDEELRHYFGPKFWKKTYLLQDIESIEQVRNSWIFGWGIRLTPHGWLYNVSGLDAVEITLRSDRKFRIGTDDPQGVLAAVSEKILDSHT